MKYLCSVFILLFFVPSLAQAQENELVFTNRQSIGDGKNGRTWSQWKKDVGDKRIGKVTVIARRQRGKNVYLNLRFGNGRTLDNGKRESLVGNDQQTLSWNVGGQRSSGEPLVLKVYNGKALIESVSVEVLPELPKPKPKPAAVQNSQPAPAPVARQSREERRNSLDPEARSGCERRESLRRATIEVAKVKESGGLFSGKRRVAGSIKAACVEEAGYYENGQLVSSFDLPFQNRFSRSQFEVQVRSGKNGEFRVLTYDGNEEVLNVDEIIVEAGEQERLNRKRRRQGIPYSGRGR